MTVTKAGGWEKNGEQEKKKSKYDGGCQGLSGECLGELLLMGTGFPFCKMERILEVDGGDGCTTV